MFYVQINPPFSSLDHFTEAINYNQKKTVYN